MDGATKMTEQRTLFAMLLSALGGIMDGYSYAVRGGVFATGQTGNLLIFGFDILKGQPDRALRALVPIISFWCGIFAAQFLLHRFARRNGSGNWKSAVLFVEAAALFVVGLVSDSVLDTIPI